MSGETKNSSQSDEHLGTSASKGVPLCVCVCVSVCLMSKKDSREMRTDSFTRTSLFVLYLECNNTHAHAHTRIQHQNRCIHNDSLHFGTSIPSPGWWAGVAFP